MAEQPAEQGPDCPDGQHGWDRVPHQHVRRRRRFWCEIRRVPPRYRWFMVLGILTYTLGYAVFLGYHKTQRVKLYLESEQWHLNRAIIAVTGKPLFALSLPDLEEASQELALAEDYFRQAQAEVAPYTSLLQVVGGDAAASPHLIDAAIETCAAGQDLYTGLEPALALLLADPQSPELAYRVGVEQRIVAPLLEEQPRLIDARDHLAAAMAASERVE